MSLVGKNRKVFSYINQDRRKSNFTYKDFEKSNSYRTNFSESDFSFASLRAAKFKFCSFYGATFLRTEFIETNLRGSNFINATFKDCIFKAAVLDKANFSNATFENTILINTSIKTAKKLSEDTVGIIFSPKILEISKELAEATEKLRKNDIIRRSNVLHMKKGKLNKLFLSLLLEKFTEEELTKAFMILPEHLTTQFHTLSYLENLLKKMRCSGII